MNKIEEVLNEYANTPGYEFDVDLAEESQQEWHDIKTFWNEYKSFLTDKYPDEDGQKCDLTGEHYQRIDALINGKKS